MLAREGNHYAANHSFGPLLWAHNRWLIKTIAHFFGLQKWGSVLQNGVATSLCT